MRRGEPERLGAFELEADMLCEYVDAAIEAFDAPQMLPRRPQWALEPEAYADNIRAGRRDVDGMHATAAWLRMRAEAQQQNRASLNALLWAARQYRDALPEEMHGARGQRLSEILVRNWGLRTDVPDTLAGCRALSNAYGTESWAELNRRRAA